jgi:hypothetical protein
MRADGSARYTDADVTVADWEELAPFDETDTTKVLLEPGDLLILPAGVWHEACGGAAGSLALNLTFSPFSYSLLMPNLLDALFTPEPDWRSGEPVLPGDVPGEVDPQGIAAISAQLARAGAALQSLSGDSAAVVRAWEALVQNPNPGFPAPYSPPVAAAPVLPGQRLRVRSDGNVYAMLADGGARLCVVAGLSRELELTGIAVGFVQRILAEREFVASDCLHWHGDETAFAWSDVQSC